MRNEMIQLLNELRILFFHQIRHVDSDIDFDRFVNSLLSVTKESLGLEAVAYFKYDEWKSQFYMMATTEDIPKSVVVDSTDLLTRLNSPNRERYFLSDHSFVGFQDYQALLSVRMDQQVSGLVALKEKTPNTFSLEGKEEWFSFFKELAPILKTVLFMGKITHKEKRYAELYRVTEKFHSSMSMDAVLGEIITTLQSVYPTFEYYLLLSHDNNNHANLPIKDLDYNSGNVASMQAFVNGTVQFEDDLLERNSILYAPLKGKQGVYGVLQVVAADTLMFPKSEIEFISLLANTAGSALENAQLYQQSRQLVSDLQFINETTRYLNSNLRLNQTIQFMKKQIKKSFNATQTGFVLLSNEGEINLLPGSSKFFDTEESKPYLTFLRAKNAKNKEAHFIGELSIHLPDDHVKYHSMMAVPMLESTDLVGYTIVLHTKPYYYSFDMFKLLQSLIHHSSLAMANSMLREELEKMVITDHLTQLHSRSYLDQEMAKLMKQDEEGTFIIIDIDNFKRVNDTYGHQVGDEILVQVAKLLQANIRETDIGARWGGEELAIYLPNVHLSIGVQIAERLKNAVADHTHPRVTISCGVSYWAKVDSDNVKELFKRADEALYIAKNTGKNRVQVQS